MKEIDKSNGEYTYVRGIILIFYTTCTYGILTQLHYYSQDLILAHQM